MVVDSSSPAASSLASSSVASDSESDNDNKLKRKFTALDSDSESSSDDDSDPKAEGSSSSRTSGNGSDTSDSDSDSDSDPGSEVEEKPHRTKREAIRNGNKTEKEARKREKMNAKTEEGDAKMDVDEPEEVGGEEEVKVLSHKEQRRLKKKQQKQKAVDVAAAAVREPKDKANQKDVKELPRRQNSVWVGNLSFHTTPDALRAFFEDVGAREVTRVHMPTKGAPAVEKMKGVKTVRENRGFAYVDFSTPEAKALAVTFSERNLDGRRLLIKDGNDFTGRPTTSNPTTTTSTQDASENNPAADEDQDPTATVATTTDKPSGFQTGPTKTAKKILKAQKQPPCPCLFLGNLGFEATKERIKQMFEGHARALAVMREKKRREKEAKKSKREGKKGGEGDNEGGREEVGEENVEVDVGIRKVRMGTFEDSGVCKGWAFVDFTSTSHATAALTNPRNHFLDGRALVVEYASPEAARRGGHRPLSEKDKSSGPKKVPKRSGENKYNDWKRKRKHVDDAGDEGKEAAENDKEKDSTPRSKRQRTDENARASRKTDDLKSGKKEKRQRPGAALAQAQREKYTIVPSQGTRLRFG